MSEKRTHYILVCEDCTPSCPCCQSCKGLGFDFVQYEKDWGYHYKAPTSITSSSAIKRLEILGVTGFLLIACRSRVNPKEISLVRQGLKRPAFYDDPSKEEVLTKKLRASLLKEVRIEVSKELSKFNRKWEQRMVKTEAAQMEIKDQVAEHNEQILGLRKDQDLSTLEMKAREEEFKKVIDEFGQRMSQMSKDVKDGIQFGVQDGIQAGIRGIKSMLPQLLPKQPQLITQKKPTQVRNSNSAGLASVPSTTGQTRPQLASHSEPTAAQREFPFKETLGNY